MKTARDFIGEFHAAYNHEAAQAGELNTDNHQLKELILDKFKENYSLVSGPDSEFLNLWGLFIAMTSNPKIFHYGGETLRVLNSLVSDLEDILHLKAYPILDSSNDNVDKDEEEEEDEEEEWKRSD